MTTRRELPPLFCRLMDSTCSIFGCRWRVRCARCWWRRLTLPSIPAIRREAVPRSFFRSPTGFVTDDSRFKAGSTQLPANNGPNAIHGFALDAAWDVVEHKAGTDEAFVVGRYQISRQSPAAHALWPADAVLQVRYGLAGRRLSMTVTVSNPTASDFPYGFGIHPYFRLPFAPGGDLGQTSVILPASKYWVLKDFLPTGEVRPVDARLDFRAGQPIKGLKLDDVLTGLDFPAERGLCRLVDLDKKAEFRITFDRGIRELVVYTPPQQPDVLAVEPYTQTTDAINLKAQGIDAGLRVLGHGRQETVTITMETLG